MNENDLRPLGELVQNLHDLLENCGIEYDESGAGRACHTMPADQLLAMIMDAARNGENVYNGYAAQIPYAQTFREKTGRGCGDCPQIATDQGKLAATNYDDELPCSGASQ